MAAAVEGTADLVAEVAAAGENHRQPMLITSVNGFLIAFGPAGLDHSGHPVSSGEVRSVAKREECVGRQNRSLSAWAGLLDGDSHRVESAHLAGADADQLTVLHQHDGVGFDRRADAPREGEVAALGFGRRRRVATVPLAGSGSSSSQVWTSKPPWMRRRSRPAGGLPGGPSGCSRSSSRTLFFQLGLVLSHSSAASSNRGQDGFQEPARLAHSLGGRPIDDSVEAHDAAEGTDRISQIGELEGGRRVVGDRGTTGVVMLEDAGRRLGKA